MKTLLVLVLATSSLAFSAPMRTQDNLTYIITMKPRADFKSCALRICQISKAQGTGDCQVYPRFGIVTANLTSYGVKIVQQTKCAKAIEEDQEVEAQPRVGRQN